MEDIVVSAFIAALIAWFVGFLMGGYAMYTDWRNWAVRHHLAEWQVNSKTGDKSFVWLCERKTVA